jgi:hypothetical protein
MHRDVGQRHYAIQLATPPESELTVGQSSDDWNEVARIASVSSLLRFIGSKLVS